MAGNSLRVKVKVVPGASGDKVVGWLADALKVRVRAAPEKGKANRAVETLLAGALAVDEACVKIVSGHSASRKVVEIAGVSEAEMRRRVKLLPITGAAATNASSRG